MRPRPRTFMAGQAVRLAERWLDRTLLPVEHVSRSPRARYGYGSPPHQGLLEILRRGEDAYRRNLELLAGYGADLARLGGEPSTPTVPALANQWLAPVDCVALYGFLRSRAPRSYVEIGSGISTLFARRAITDEGSATRITSIDPHPRRDVESACEVSIRKLLEEVDLALFDDLVAGDIVFMDGSHHVFTNSDATVFFLDVLPSLPSGVLVCVHDILLPDDYLPMWTGHHWSEQYLMASYLLARGDQVQLELATNYVTEHSDLHHILDPLWSAPALEGVPRRGFGLWLSTSGR